MKDHHLKVTKLNTVQPIDGDNTRKRLLFKTFEDATKLKEFGYEYSNDYQVELAYENYNMNDALKKIMNPDEANQQFDDSEIPSGFEIIGDIAHLNLSKKQQPYKFKIG